MNPARKRGAASMPLLIVLFLISGATGLVYELVWTRTLIFVFGGTTYAITTVLVAFMGGLGLGCWLVGRIVERLRRPERIYGLLEVFIGLYALCVPVLFRFVEPLYRAIYPHVSDAPGLLTAVRFCVGAAVMILPTTCMGATLPLLVRYATLAGGRTGASVGLLYGVNTFGAMIGVLLTGFAFLPSFGLELSTQLAAAANVAVGLAAMFLLRRKAATRVAAGGEEGGSASVEPSRAAPISAGVRRLVLVTCAGSGFAAMVYQVGWTRALAMALGSSTYSFTCILAAFIMGLALGSLAVARLADRWSRPVALIAGVQIFIGLSAVLVLPLQGWTPVLVYYLIEARPGSFNALLAWEFLLIILFTFVPTFFMGTLFPVFARVVARGSHDAGRATGVVYGVNTLGTILGSFLTGFVLIGSPLGLHGSIVLASMLNVVLGAMLMWTTRGQGGGAWRVALSAVAIVLAPGLGWTIGRWDPYLLTSGPFIAGFDPRQLSQRVDLLHYSDGPDLSVSVLRANADPELLSLRVNAKTDASTALTDMTSQLMLGHLPMLLHGAADDVCVIGLGSGMTLGAVTRHREPRRIDAIEISAEVLKAAKYFAPYNNDAIDPEADGFAAGDARVQLIRADGRNHLLLTDRKYDVIISVPSNPWISGVANLFTREYFALCRDRLEPEGRLCVWLQGYMMPLENFRLIIRTLFDQFPEVSLWEMGDNDYVLVASESARRPTAAQIREHFMLPDVRVDLYRVGMGRPERLLARFIASGARLRDWAGEGPIHTDDNALIEFSAPRSLLQPRVYEITTAVQSLKTSPLDEFLPPDTSDSQRDQLAARILRISRAEHMVLAAAFDDQLTLTQRCRALLEAYSVDPGSYRVFVGLNTLRQPLRDAARTDPAAVELLDRIERLRAPTVAPRRARTIEDVTQQLRVLAGAAVEREHWPAAIDYLSEAYELDPGDVDVVIKFAYALLAGDHASEAARVLIHAVEAGLLSREALERSQSFAPLMDIPEYRALFEDSSAD
ncbi:MAG: hypothetical protein D6744_11150 [Planctomycetota bacterium]|nr:MAG: hypothetical protein D6744_11150 [Planctomycetota bacterium]